MTGRGSVSGDEIYISNTPGFIYSDGTFEFRNVPPGMHNIVMNTRDVVTAATIRVGGQDIDGVELQRPTILPADIFSDPQKPPDGAIPDSKTFPLMSIAGRVVDEISQEAISEGTVTIAGYGIARRAYAIIDGHFDIPSLLPGSYRITLNVAGYANATQPVTVGTEDLKLDLIGRREPR